MNAVLVAPNQAPAVQTSVTHSKRNWIWFTVVWYAIGMAWVESAVVYYLRTLVDRIQPYQPNPLPLVGDLGAVEILREAATLLMLLTIGILAGKTLRSRLAYSALAFGVWDIFYYIFLKVMTGWPDSLADWDILFLIPLPWWGPVWAPMTIAALMMVWGSLVSRFEHNLPAENWRLWAVASLGVVIALYCFMVDALRIMQDGEEALRMFLPTKFNTPLFLLSVALMSAPVWRSISQLGRTAVAHH